MLIVTQDDVACLIHIPIQGRLMHYDDCNYELSIQLIQSEMGLTKKEAEEELSTQWGGNISNPS